MAIGITDKFKPKGYDKFALMDAEDIEHEGVQLNKFLPIEMTQEAFEEMVAKGEYDKDQYYVILEEEE